jgi:hypothetical protein
MAATTRSQKAAVSKIAAKRVSRTAPETVVTATILIRFCLAIAIIDAGQTGAGLVFDFLRLAFCGVFFAGIAFP